MQQTFTLAPTKKQEFASKDGATISLGCSKRSGYEIQRDHGPSMIAHDNSQVNLNHQKHFLEENRGGLSTTKFGKGFQRRHESSVMNLAKIEIETKKSNSNNKAYEARKYILQSFDSFNKYDIITGGRKNGIDSSETTNKSQGIRILGDGLGPEAAHRGHLLLRNSSNRFFTPQYSGPKHEYRQTVLLSDGLLGNKKTTILQTRKQYAIDSFGIEDQFSKSEYFPKYNESKIGLVETREPGRFTPRKQANNPSGDPSATVTWAKGVTLKDYKPRSNPIIS